MIVRGKRPTINESLIPRLKTIETDKSHQGGDPKLRTAAEAEGPLPLERTEPDLPNLEGPDHGLPSDPKGPGQSHQRRPRDHAHGLHTKVGNQDHLVDIIGDLDQNQLHEGQEDPIHRHPRGVATSHHLLQ